MAETSTSGAGGRSRRPSPVAPDGPADNAANRNEPIVIDLGLLPGEVCGDWSHEAASVCDEDGNVIGYVSSNDGARVIIYLTGGDDAGS